MGEAIEELAHFIAGTPWEAIPKAVREHAKLVLLDTVGVILAGPVPSWGRLYQRRHRAGRRPAVTENGCYVSYPRVSLKVRSSAPARLRPSSSARSTAPTATAVSWRNASGSDGIAAQSCLRSLVRTTGRRAWFQALMPPRYQYRFLYPSSLAVSVAL